MDEKEIPIWERVTVDGNLNQPDEEIEYTEAEQTAMAKGWKPQHEWTGNQDEWRSAKEYLDRSSFFEKINSQKRELEEMRRFQQEAKEHLRKLRESQEQDRLDKLTYQKREALEENDIETVMATDTKIRHVEKELQDIKEETPYNPDQAQSDQMFNEWKDDNPWYEADTELRTLADALGLSFRQANPNAQAQEVYNYVTEKVKAVNPNKFSPNNNNPQSRAPNSTTQQPPRSATKHGKTYRDLSDDQYSIGKKFVRLGLYPDIQGYVNDLVATGEV